MSRKTARCLFFFPGISRAVSGWGPRQYRVSMRDCCGPMRRFAFCRQKVQKVQKVQRVLEALCSAAAGGNDSPGLAGMPVWCLRTHRKSATELWPENWRLWCRICWMLMSMGRVCGQTPDAGHTQSV
ncbi:MAG: hypothetical protein OXC07_11975 [Kistimonas sp.]|nr:hypothetical protein [Kistimonas sp.]